MILYSNQEEGEMAPVDAVGWGGAAASIMFILAVARQYFPHGLETYFRKYIHKLWSYFYPYIEITFQEYSGQRMNRSEVYTTIRTYLSATATEQAKRLVAAEAGDKDNHDLVLSLDDLEQVTDDFRGIKFWWTSRKKHTQRSVISWYPSQEEPRYYRLTVHRKHRHLLDDYLRHVREQGKAIEVRTRRRKLYTNNPTTNWYGYKKSVWSHTVLEHPATFDTLAMEPRKKDEILRDLENFNRGKDFYKKIGRAWKRGYLLHGPPGTGKSTMIAAIANKLDYDIYDLELTAVKDNTELRKLLIETTPKSLIVIEDIDCSQDLSGKRKKKAEKDEEEDRDQIPPGPGLPPKEEEKKMSKVTLSGLLNFIDGLWSSCGGERLIVFTTNHLEKLDPALIRRGRMDKHIELSYCCFETFKVLAKNYLGVDSHPLFQTVKELLGECKITPADVAENLMPISYIAEEAEANNQLCLESLIQALKIKAKEEAEALRAAEDNRKAVKKAKEEAALETQKNSKEKTEENETLKKGYRKDTSSNGTDQVGIVLQD